jgi:hypothetical protein
MKLLPYEHFIVRTVLPPEEVQRRILDLLGPPPLLPWLNPEHKPYQGKMMGAKFSLYRIIAYKNTSLPCIFGAVHGDSTGSAVDITVHPHILSGLFAILWLIIPLGAVLAKMVETALRILFRQPVEFYGLYALGVVTAFLAAMYAVSYLGFKVEAVKARRDLVEYIVLDKDNPDVEYVDRLFGLSEKQILALGALLFLAVLSAIVLVRMLFVA